MIVTRDVFHSEVRETDKESDSYIELSATLYMREEDMKKFDLGDGDVVEITSTANNNSLRVSVKNSNEAPPGKAMMVNSILVNQLVSIENLKRFKAKIKKVGGNVTRPEDIMAKFERK